MLKIINIILVFFFLPMTFEYNIGYVFLIPTILFYLKKDIKNIYYIYIPALLSTILFSFKNSIIVLLILIITTGFYFLFNYFKKREYKFIKHELLFDCLFVFSLNMLTYLFFNKINIILFMLCCFVSSLLYIYYQRLLSKHVFDSSNKQSIVYLDFMIAIISVLGAIKQDVFNINLGLLLSAFFTMYFSRTYKNIFSSIFSIVSLLIGYGIFKISDFMFIPIIGGLYLIDNMFIMLVTNVLIVFGIFLPNTIYDTFNLLGLMGVSIVFELLNGFLIESKKFDYEVTEQIYEKIQNSTSTEMLNFALFLDKFSLSFKNPKEYNERLSDGIKTIVQTHCINCPKSKECFNIYKTELYNIFKDILLLKEDYKQNNNKFSSYCNKLSSIEHTAKLLDKNFSSLNPKESLNNNTLIAQINALSNTIKKYVLDINSKQELSYYELMSLKNALSEYGLDIIYYEIIKQYEDDFLITIGIKNKQFDDIKKIIEMICTTYIGKDLSVVLYKEEGKNIYINVLPKIQIDITYGFGSLTAEELDICGDNYLVKEMKNGRFISAISDGMGKGYRAFYESDMTLKLIEDIIKLNISCDTALEILNTFYSVQDYLEQYATLDFLEINRYDKIANFYKMGATTSYIFKKNGSIDKIINKNLPFGIDDEVDMYSYKLENGDLILMSSDGIFENVVNVTDFENFINNIKNYPPQRIVYEILNYTISHKIKAKDDMSIIALKIQNAA